eukprot:scaffold41249_cov58-Phaeocystis_antarctica.AAC.2
MGVDEKFRRSPEIPFDSVAGIEFSPARPHVGVLKPIFFFAGHVDKLRTSSERLGQPHFWSPMPPAALAVTAEGASCAARAVPSEGMQTTRTTCLCPG